MAPFLPPGGCVPPRLWFSGAISPGDSSLWPGPTTTQSGSYFSINRPLSASHEAMSQCSPLAIESRLVQACVKMRRIRRGFRGESTVFSTDCISSVSAATLGKNKRAKKDDQALRTSVHIQIGKHLDCRPDRLVHDDTGTSAETSCQPP